MGRRLRQLAGVREELLDRVPAERPRYTGLGGVVLGTATLGALSLCLGLTQVLDGFHPVILLLVAFWGLFLLNFDRWLVATGSGTRWQRRAAMLVPRLAMAVVLSAVIAEPVVLRVFQTAVEERVQLERWAEDDELRGQLIRCNPEPDSQGRVLRPGDRSCDAYQLNLLNDPERVGNELQRSTTERQRLANEVARKEREYQRLQTAARNECDGIKTPETTGVLGYGPACRDRQRDAAEYHRDTVKPDKAALTRLDRDVERLKAQYSRAGLSYREDRQEAIARRVAEQSGSRDRIGLLERFLALHRLMRGDAFLAGAVWTIRLFLTLLDCMPLLVKLFGGTSTYDRLVEEELGRAERTFRVTSRAAERVETAEAQRQLYELDSQLRRHHRDVDDAERRHMEELDQWKAARQSANDRDVDAEIDRLEARFLGQERPTRLNGHVLGAYRP